MPIYSIIFASSLVLIIGMILARLLYEKLHDGHFFHKVVTHRARKANVKLKTKMKRVRRIIRYFNKKTFTLLLHLLIEEIEDKFHKATDWAKSKLPHHK
jgi:hypothetical protein